jgi:hypothetical protein
MNKTIIIDATLRYEGYEPELTLTRRIQQPDDETLEQTAERELKQMCRELHAPKWKTQIV